MNPYSDKFTHKQDYYIRVFSNSNYPVIVWFFTHLEAVMFFESIMELEDDHTRLELWSKRKDLPDALLRWSE